MACMNRKRGKSPREQAKLQQYKMLSEKFEKLDSILINHYEGCKVKKAIVFSGDDWQDGNVPPKTDPPWGNLSA